MLDFWKYKQTRILLERNYWPRNRACSYIFTNTRSIRISKLTAFDFQLSLLKHGFNNYWILLKMSNYWLVILCTMLSQLYEMENHYTVSSDPLPPPAAPPPSHPLPFSSSTSSGSKKPKRTPLYQRSVSQGTYWQTCHLSMGILSI